MLELKQNVRLIFKRRFALYFLATIFLMGGFFVRQLFVSQALAVVGDTTPPINGYITYDNGYVAGGVVAIAYYAGTDDESGLNIDSGNIQRASAPLVNGECGVFSDFTSLVFAVDGNYTDTATTSAVCYKYQYVIADLENNVATYTSDNIIKIDTVAPVIAAVGDLSAEAVSSSGAIINYNLPTATDDVDAAVAVSCDPISGSEFMLGDTQVTCDAMDSAGNGAVSATFWVHVSDTVPPVFSNVPNTIVTGATDQTGVSVLYDLPTANDLVSGVANVNCDPAPGSIFIYGTSTVTCSATDGTGNSTSTAFLVRVNDIAPPVITLNGDNPQMLTYKTNYVELGATLSDNYDANPSMLVDTSTLNINVLGDYNVAYRAVDAAGNQSEPVTRIVRVLDNIAPVVRLNGADVQLVKLGTDYSEQGATADDNYDSGLIVNIDTSLVTTNALGEYLVGYNATDSSGNQAETKYRTVRVVENLPSTGFVILPQVKKVAPLPFVEAINKQPQTTVDTRQVLGVKLYADGVLVRARGLRGVYVMENGVARHIKTLAELQKYYFGRKITATSEEVLNSLLKK